MNKEELLEQYARGKRDFSGAQLDETSLMGADLPEIILRRSRLNVANLSNANLVDSDLAEANLNVTRLSGANLSRANLKGCKLNVSNLIRCLLIEANLMNASLIRAEMLRADLSNAQLTLADLSEADMREARLRYADLSQANLNRADLRSSILTGANLTQANLISINGDRANFQGSLLTEAELRHSNLSCADLSGANLRGANLRWANLNGANLREADLSYAKLSGAKLNGTSLEGANITNTVFVHADLTNANFMYANWVGADLSGANLTGIKLFSTVRYNLTTDNVRCDWVDLSANGDQSRLQRFDTPEILNNFLNRSPAKLDLILDTHLTPGSHRHLAVVGYKLAQLSPLLNLSPSIQVESRETVLTYTVPEDVQLFALAYGILTPFQEGRRGQESLRKLLRQTQTQMKVTAAVDMPHLALNKAMGAVAQMIQQIEPIVVNYEEEEGGLEQTFFQAPLSVHLVNSNNQLLTLYRSPRFGTRELSSPQTLPPALPQPNVSTPDTLIKFLQGCRRASI